MFLVKGSRRCAYADLLHRISALSARRRVGRAVFKTEDLSFAYSVFNVLVEMSGLEPLTPCLQSRCSPN
jgi:hypothetical protein